MLQPGTLIGSKYRIVRLMGEGGMGTVYEAQHQVLGSRVALKFLRPEIAEQANLQQRFLQEARVSATVEDEHIAHVTDVDTSPEGAYLVMELLKGEPLTNLLSGEGRLDVERTVHFALQIGKGLKAAHARSIVHRDLKPDNVFLTQSAAGPLLKLLDFGIAKLRETQEYQMTLTRPGSVMGTPEYMAPEQAFGAETVDLRSDIYALGVMMFEMLSGKVPVEGENPQEIAERILRGQVARLSELRPELPRDLVAVIERATHPRPEQRFSDVDELSQALLPFAPAIDRLSLSGPLPGMARGFQTGLSTPFTPIAVTPFTGDAAGAGRQREKPQSSAIPNTIPPDDSGPPAASRLPEAPRVRTQSMPQAEAPGLPQLGPQPSPQLNPEAGPQLSPVRALGEASTVLKSRKSGGIGWIVLGVVIVGAAAGGLFYYEEFVADSPTPPPQPVPRASNGHGPTLQQDVLTDLDEPDLPRIGEDRPRTGRGSPSPSAGRDFPQLPPLTLPTQLPTLPPGLPTELPRTLPTLLPIPGIPAPGITGPGNEAPR